MSRPRKDVVPELDHLHGRMYNTPDHVQEQEIVPDSNGAVHKSPMTVKLVNGEKYLTMSLGGIEICKAGSAVNPTTVIGGPKRHVGKGALGDFS